MNILSTNIGAIDNRFLGKSIGLLNPPAPIVISENDSLARTLKLLQENKIGCIVVVNSYSKVAGIFTERDVVLKVILQDIDLANTPVAKCMTPAPKTASMTTTIAFALQMMSQGGYRHIPIVDDEGFPIGIISVKDIIDYLSNSVFYDIDIVNGAD